MLTKKQKKMFGNEEKNPMRKKSGPYCAVCGASIQLKDEKYYCPYCKKYMD
jgi:predicted RNA-binding Zn-ribbon protein involved in translation (DUF1610 family)